MVCVCGGGGGEPMMLASRRRVFGGRGGVDGGGDEGYDRRGGKRKEDNMSWGSRGEVEFYLEIPLAVVTSQLVTSIGYSL